MINVHFNGDIIRCPDIAAIQQHTAKIRDDHFICPFGVHQFYCRTWMLYCRKNAKNIHTRLTVHCPLHKKIKYRGKEIYICKKARERYQNSKKQKHFSIDNTNYRKVASAAHHLVKTSPHKSLFLLLSFPPWLPGFNPYKNEKRLNECFSRFMENLRQNYNCAGYLAARELGHDNRRYHYHLVCSIPFVPFANINAAWCAAISDICETSKNAIQSRKENRIIQRLNSPARAVRYICKYITKCKGQASKTRVLFMSNNLIKKPMPVRNEDAQYFDRTGIYDVQSYLLQFKSVKVTKLNDYTSAFRIENNEDFDRICQELIYPLFYIKDEKPIDLYSFPDKKPPSG